MPKATDNLTQILQSQTDLRVIETRLKHQDGSWCIFETIGRNRLDDPAIQGILINTRDVTERVQAERTLKESEEKFRSLAEQSPNMIFINQRGRVVYANKRCEEMMGYTRDEFYAPDFDFMILVPPEHRELVKTSFEKHVRGQDVEPYEYSLVTRDGQRIESILNSKLIDYGGEKAILGIVTDISHRKQVERTLQLTNAVLSTQQETSPDGILVVDQAGRMISFNQRFVDMWEIPPDVLEQRSDQLALQAVQRKLVEPDAFLAKVDYLYQHLHEKSHDEIKLIDGRTFDRYSAPMWGADGQYYGRVWYFRDVTETKQAEDALLEHAAELQARNEELNAFAHTVAHDLKNPLALVIGFAETLTQAHAELSAGETQKYLQSIAQNSRKMENIIDELLLLAQIREEEICLAPLDMGCIVTEAQQRLAHLIEQHQATIIAPQPESWPQALGYAPWVEEVWGNYLSNAIQHSGASPRVELGFDLPTDGEVRFWVKDNGPGIPPAKQAGLFVPFTHLAQSRGKGHGLGLSIVRRIVEKLGGQVDVESRGLAGQGSLFSFTLPLADPEPET
jgi:PAS domain S-box-containing protein